MLKQHQAIVIQDYYTVSKRFFAYRGHLRRAVAVSIAVVNNLKVNKTGIGRRLAELLFEEHSSNTLLQNGEHARGVAEQDGKEAKKQRAAKAGNGNGRAEKLEYY